MVIALCAPSVHADPDSWSTTFWHRVPFLHSPEGTLGICVCVMIMKKKGGFLSVSYHRVSSIILKRSIWCTICVSVRALFV